MRKHFLLYIVLFIILFFSCNREKTEPVSSPASQAQVTQPYRVLHIMSYHTPWKWTDDQLQGFKEALKDLAVIYQVHSLNQKYASPDTLVTSVQAAKDAIREFKPDLVYTTDDYVQEAVVSEFLNTDIPFVFSGVNSPPSTYGFDQASNVRGIMEQELFIPVINLLRKLVPDLKKIAIITDNGTMWPSMLQRMQSKARENLPDLEIVGWDVLETYAEYQQRVLDYQDQVDAIGLLGVFLFKDSTGNNKPFEQVLQWTVNNSRLPDFSFWADRIPKGTLCAVSVSGYEQGLAAGKIARGILVDGKKPADFENKPTIKGEPVISLARANAIGIKVDADLLLLADIIEEFEWE